MELKGVSSQDISLDPAVNYFARITWRNSGPLFGIRQADRFMHTYMIGKTGTGKSTCIETMMYQDIVAGRGCCLLDPHGDLVEKVANSIPEWRKNDLVYLNIPDENLNIRYNPFKYVSKEKRSLVASGILEVFSKLWSSAWGVKLEHILRYTILTLLHVPNSSISDIPELLLNRSYRNSIIRKIKDDNIQKFWQREFPEYTKSDLLPVLNKIGGLLVHLSIRRVLIENQNDLSLRQAMDEKKIILVNLSKGHLGADVSHILGALFVTSLASAAFSRADTPEYQRVPFMVYMDEFHNFTTQSLVNMFSELRKFKVGMVLAHQYLHQLDENIKRSVLGNVGTIISFRVGMEDAKYLTKEMYPIFEVEDFINLPNYRIYLKLMIDGRPSRPFSAKTITKEQLG